MTTDQGGSGFYKDQYIDRATGETRYLAATQFETAEARWAFPCLDEPGLKATFDIRIGRLQTLMSLANTPLESTDVPVPGYPGYVWDDYMTTVLQPTYLNSFFVGDYASVLSDPTPDGVLFNTWARPDAVADGLAEYSRVIGPAIEQHFGDLFSIPFPLVKQDQIAYPSKGGAMENWGLVTYGETALLLSDLESSDSDRFGVASINAHELAHMWFGDLVTTQWWDHIWLNEGFATYVSFYGTSHVEPDMMNWDRFYIEEMRSILRTDSLPNSAPMLVEVNHPSDANFGSNTYNRGATMLRMIEHFLTRTTLISALNKYLTDKSYSNAVTDDLWFYLNREGHTDGTLSPLYDFGTVMDPWLKQRNYPLLTVTRDYTTGEVALRQQRFLTEEDTSGDTHDYQWYIPVTYTTASQDSAGDFDTSVLSRFFLEPGTVLDFNVGVSDETALFFNIQSVGYYRVNYDAENWNRIILLLQNPATFASIHVINRAQLLYDSYALAFAGIESYDLPLRVFSYLDAGLEMDYLPLSTAIEVYIRLRGMGNLPADGLELRANLLTVLSNKYDVVGLAPNENNPYGDNMIQRELISAMCGEDLPSCRDDSVAVFAQWMQTPNPEVPANNPVNRQARSSIYCTAIRNGGQAEYDFLANQLTLTFNPQQQSAIRSGLGCSSKEANLRELLEGSNFNDALTSMASKPKGRGFVWQWLAERCDDGAISKRDSKVMRTLMKTMDQGEGVQEVDRLIMKEFLEACPRMDDEVKAAIQKML